MVMMNVRVHVGHPLEPRVTEVQAAYGVLLLRVTTELNDKGTILIT